MTVFMNRLNDRVPDVDTVADAWAPPRPPHRPHPPPHRRRCRPGFPSMEFPPPTIDLPDGQPQPIATKFGLTYDIPAGWENFDDLLTSATDEAAKIERSLAEADAPDVRFHRTEPTDTWSQACRPHDGRGPHPARLDSGLIQHRTRDHRP